VAQDPNRISVGIKIETWEAAIRASKAKFGSTQDDVMRLLLHAVDNRYKKQLPLKPPPKARR